MSGPLLSTKLFIPRPTARMVVRDRVGDLLDQGLAARLTLVSAQAGFGKTTAVADWVHRRPTAGRVAWLSLDPADADPRTFWTYVVSALATTVPGLAEELLPLLERPGPPTRAVLTELLNRLAASDQDVVLVLDDYQAAESPEVAEGLEFLLTHLPARTHAVICTRIDPSLPLSRLRARGELVEVRAADLRFSGAEAASYLRNAGLQLDQGQVAILESRTEGWAAALQLAALSMQDRTDVDDFLADFAGDDRFILDYLVEEVLGRQPEDVRAFLLRTSVLDRLTGPLCDAVTGQDEGAETLQRLERENLFVVPLDTRRQWYRYHHLFADVLRAHASSDPMGTSVTTLHRRASAWYHAAGQAVPAVRHALSAGDLTGAAALMEVAIPDLLRQRRETVIAGWADSLPAEVVRARPALAMGFVAGLMAHTDVTSVPRRLDDLEALLARLETRPPAQLGVVVEDPTELVRLPGKVQLYRAAYALLTEDLAGTHRHVATATTVASADDHPTRAGAWGLSGLAHWRTGDLEATHHCYSRCVDELQLAGHVSDVLGCTTTLADIRMTQGRLGEADRTLHDALGLATSTGAVPRGVADMHAGLAEVALERGQLEEAEDHLRRAQQLGDAAGMPQHASHVRVVMALVRAARADVDEAVNLLDEAERLYVSDFKPDVRPVHATRARLLVGQGRLDEARRWADRRQLGTDQELTYVREYEHVTLARLLLAQARAGRTRDVAQVRAFLTRLHASCEEAGRHGTLLDVVVLEACGAMAAGDHPAAADHVRLALRLSGPERSMRSFTDHAADVPRLVALLAEDERETAWVQALLAACVPGRAAPTRPPPRTAGRTLVEPLSPRELDVLRLLATDLSGPEMARHLVVSLNTIRTHTRNVYSKLGVGGRRAAVTRARELDLLDRHHA